MSKPASLRFRWLLLTLLLAASFLNYFDRQALSVLKATIKADLGFTDVDYALLVNAFTACYALAYLGSGWFVDRFGPKKALTVFVGVWSLATVGCGFARSLASLAFLRGILGLAEPGLHPVSLRTGTTWAPAGKRGLFLSLCGLGSSLGTIAAPPLIAWCTLHYHWRLAFVLPGVLGLVLAAVWWFGYRDPSPTELAEAPPEAATALAAEPLPWKQLWRQRVLWGIVLSRLISDPVWYFCMFWMPGYLQENRGLSITQMGFVGWIPFAAANLAGLGAAALSDRFASRSPDRLHARKRLLYFTGLGGPIAIFIALEPSVPITLGLFCVVAVICASWLYSIPLLITETFPLRNIASVYGISGAFGATGAMVFNYFIGHAVQSMGQATFLIMGALHPLAALILWWLVRRPAEASRTI